LKWRLCDLGLAIEGSLLEKRIGRLYGELERRGLCFRPHFWLSDEWFTPDGVPGVAIPFYLAHPRLVQLERSQMLEVEGGSEDACMRILRHETGHALDTAFRLHRRKQYLKTFGRYAEPYPEHYRPKPHSKNYVLHLEPSYAQAHPAEDFAETFAVWLMPRSAWRMRYEGWPVLKKLEYVAELMEEIRGQKPVVVSQQRVEPIEKLRKTLGDHYGNRRKQRRTRLPHLYDRHLLRLFSDAAQHGAGVSAAQFLRRNRAKLRRAVAQWTGECQYTIDQVLRDMIARSGELNLRVHRPLHDAYRDALVLITAQTMNYLHGGHYRVTL
jgi:hypothetical protein